MFVKAAPGLKVPKESQPRDYVADDTVVEVEATAYYLRRLSDGDLIAQPPTKAKPARGTVSGAAGDIKGAD